MSRTTAIFAGTFDPVTYGHLDCVRRGARLFERVIVSVAEGGRKTLFSAPERAALFEAALDGLAGVTVETFEGLVVEQARRRDAVVLIRGTRTTQDWNYEVQMALANRGLADEIDTLFLPPSPGMSQVSSSLVREVASLGGDVSPWVPPVVLTALGERLGKRSP